MADGEIQPEGKKKKGPLKWILLILLLLLLGAGGAVGYMYWTKTYIFAEKNAEEPAVEEQQAPGEVKGFKDLVTLPTFLVNLADPLGRRYVKLSLEVEVTDEKAAAELSGAEAKVRDAVILLLSSKTYQDLSTVESKILLKKEVVERLNQILGGRKVLRVYITEMVIQ